VARYGGGHKVKIFPAIDHYLCMALLTDLSRKLRDIEACLRAQAGQLYHMGIKRVSRSTLAMQESRDCASTPTCPVAHRIARRL